MHCLTMPDPGSASPDKICILCMALDLVISEKYSVIYFLIGGPGTRQIRKYVAYLAILSHEHVPEQPNYK